MNERAVNYGMVGVCVKEDIHLLVLEFEDGKRWWFSKRDVREYDYRNQHDYDITNREENK